MQWRHNRDLINLWNSAPLENVWSMAAQLHHQGFINSIWYQQEEWAHIYISIPTARKIHGKLWRNERPIIDVHVYTLAQWEKEQNGLFGFRQIQILYSILSRTSWVQRKIPGRRLHHFQSLWERLYATCDVLCNGICVGKQQVRLCHGLILKLWWKSHYPSSQNNWFCSLQTLNVT